MAVVPEWLSVSEAARRLGVSADDVRHKIRTGELRARRTNGGQVVLLEGEASPDEGEPALIVQALIAELRGQIGAKDDQLRGRDQELARLSEQMRTKDQQIERLMVLLAQGQAQMQELAQRLLPPPGPQPPPQAQRQEPGGRRSWWPFRRHSS